MKKGIFSLLIFLVFTVLLAMNTLSAVECIDSFSLKLHEGWNHVSFPISFEDNNPKVVFNSIKNDLTIVWGYDAKTGQWKKYIPDASIGNSLISIEPDKGYWVRVKRDIALNLKGKPPVILKVQLYRGWNLVGYPSMEKRKIEDIISPIKNKIEIIYHYDTWTDKWKRYTPDSILQSKSIPSGFVGVNSIGDDLKYMVSGEGYWVKAKEDISFPYMEYVFFQKNTSDGDIQKHHFFFYNSNDCYKISCDSAAASKYKDFYIEKVKDDSSTWSYKLIVYLGDKLYPSIIKENCKNNNNGWVHHWAWSTKSESLLKLLEKTAKEILERYLGRIETRPLVSFW